MRYDVDGFLNGPNGHNTGGGFTIVNGDNKLIHRVPLRKKNLTNNEAELWAVAAAVYLAQPGDTIYSDSQCVARYWVPEGRCRARSDLNALCRIANIGIQEKGLTLTWAPRDENLAGIYNEKAQNRGEEKA